MTAVFWLVHGKNSLAGHTQVRPATTAERVLVELQNTNLDESHTDGQRPLKQRGRGPDGSNGSNWRVLRSFNISLVKGMKWSECRQRGL